MGNIHLYSIPHPQTSSSRQNIKRGIQGLHFRDPKHTKTRPPKFFCHFPEANTGLWHFPHGPRLYTRVISHSVEQHFVTQRLRANKNPKFHKSHNKCHVIFQASSIIRRQQITCFKDKERTPLHSLPRGSKSKSRLMLALLRCEFRSELSSLLWYQLFVLQRCRSLIWSSNVQFVKSVYSSSCVRPQFQVLS